ncbi:GMC oxidoreductase [Coprinellus micaceus]|uniref:pyranose dehydrogenase (acceptor) n=1 Tax=Coprinellus micaceus TaxID=71717 RepID=A0A4Y7SHV1_COPMI|nr:GMC oxidoreductase [Coprinellus micaceus]
MPLLTTPDELTSKAFDYIVVGAGGSGATLASRLTEGCKRQCPPLRSRGVHYDDPVVDIPAQFAATFLNPKYDWGFPVVKQACSNNVQHVWPRGKGLGGSTSMNFLCWIKPPSQDVDAIERLGNPGWNWVDFQKYSLRAETFHPAVKEITDSFPHTYNEKNRGTSGPVGVTDPIHAYTADKVFIDTLVNKGVKLLEDPYGGEVTGAYIASNNVDPRTWKRTYSASAYLHPYEDRQNLVVLPNAYVTRVLWADEKDAERNLVASGVEYIFGEQKLTVTASKEVILSAGAIKSPHILELSGVGKPELLEKLGVDAKLDLPGVGENLQEHHFASVVFELDTTKADHQTLDLFFNPEFAKESIRLHAEGKGTHRTGITAFAFLPLTSRAPEETSAAIGNLEKDIKDRIAKGEIPPALAKQYDIQLETLKDKGLPDMELIAFPGFFGAREIPAPGKRFLSILVMLNHPISRGSIHAKTDNPQDFPEIIPNYFKEEFDTKVLVEHVKFVRSLTEIEPFKSNCTEVQPGPACTTDEQIADYLKGIHTTTFHTVGSCSMLPREDGGVVDSKLKVYGTKNLRVADISIVPLHIAAHMQTTAYAIGEKAADIVKGVI